MDEEIISKICGNVLQDLWEFGREKKSPRFVGIISKICGNVGEKKNPQDLWARFSSLYPRKKIHKICGRDFHKIFQLIPEKKNLQDLWDYFLGSKINKICGPHILLIFFYKKSGFIPKIPTFLVREIAKSRQRSFISCQAYSVQFA